jgi:glycosyltransferase involved in cell wall biosynthesis
MLKSKTNKTMKNVCFFNSVKFWGGGEKLHLEYAQEFKKKNYNVFIVSNKVSKIAERAIEDSLPVFPISVSNLSFLNPYKLFNLVRYYKNNNIDTVIFSTAQDVKLGSIAAKIAGVKNIVYLRGLAVPIKNSFVNRYVLKHALTHIVANSEETKRRILQNLNNYIDTSKVAVIYHGIEIPHETQNENFLTQIQEKRHGIVLGNAGRLTQQKGQHHLIEIAKRLKAAGIDFSLFIAGTGEMESELKDLIAKNNIQNDVFLLGFVRDMERFMNSIDIFLLSSLWEGFGYVLVEAMIKSKPIVAFNISSNPEIVVDGKTGFLIDNLDIEAFSQKTKLLIENESLRKECGLSGKERVIESFNISDRITEFEQYLLD